MERYREIKKETGQIQGKGGVGHRLNLGGRGRKRQGGTIGGLDRRWRIR